jgi:FixJ family two-component response regulator
MTGGQDKQIAYQLKLSENKVEPHRWQGMRKMQARSWVELAADKLGVSCRGS